MPKQWLMIFLAMSFAGQAWAQDAFLCAGDSTIGFSYDVQTHEWEAAYFKSDEKYILKKKDTEWSLSMLGSSFGYPCEMKPRSTFSHCRGFLDFWMNIETMRFQRNSVVLGTIIRQKDGERPDSVFMQIGRCAPI